MFSTKFYFNTQFPCGKLESNASKDQATHWFKQAKAFDTIKPNKSYAQVLVSNANVNMLVYPRAERNLGATDNKKLGIVGNNQCYSSANTVASNHKVSQKQNSVTAL